MLEWVKYSSYGVPFGLPGGDTNSDGDCDAADVTQVGTWSESTTYDVRGDIDLDGDVDVYDSGTISDDYSGITMGRGELSDGDVWNRRGYAGYETVGSPAVKWHVRNRVLDTVLGQWMRRDPIGYVNGASLYAYVSSSPVGSLDASGLFGAGGWLRKQVMEGWCWTFCNTTSDYGATKCQIPSGGFICICHNNMKSAHPGWTQDALDALAAAVLAHEEAHEEGCKGWPVSSCKEPCAYDGELTSGRNSTGMVPATRRARPRLKWKSATHVGVRAQRLEVISALVKAAK